MLPSGVPVDWATKAVYAAAEGLRKAKKGRFKPLNYLFLEDVLRAVDFLGWGSEFALLSFVPSFSSLGFPHKPFFSGGLLGMTQSTSLLIRPIRF